MLKQTVQPQQPLDEIVFDEIVFDEKAGFITKYGTTLSDKKPTVFYLRSKGRLTPTTEKKNYNCEIAEVKEKFIDYVKKDILKKHKVFDKNFLSSIDISEKGVRFGKKSYIKYDLYLKPLKTANLEGHRTLFKKYSLRINSYLRDLLKKYNIEMVCSE